ncbi:hypothetical protein QR680_002148 [Steinernema hermaphroditum]|uniref:Apple domain-containing protein n=1 Tax=Steinernema hermaphroditum TaxID=289476 RepID=A0AA39H1I3_9BILA|nr:hypothetical protein QR680_002148 [Steinernema hermaphroditum]
MDCRFLISVLLLHALIEISASSPYIRCFQKTVRRSIDNSQPMTELFYVTPYQCMDHCIVATNNHAPNARLCRSFVYDHLQHSCRLYEHDGNEPPAIIHPANGYDYYRRTAVLNQCAGPGSPSDGPLTDATNNPNFYQVKATKKNKAPGFYENINSASVQAKELPQPDVYGADSYSGQSVATETGNKKLAEAPSSDAFPSSDFKKLTANSVDQSSAGSKAKPAQRLHSHNPSTDKVIPSSLQDNLADKTEQSLPTQYITKLVNEVDIRDPIPPNPPARKVRPHSTAGLPAGSDQVVHLPNSAAELGYETPKKPKKHRTTTTTSAPAVPEFPSETIPEPLEIPELPVQPASTRRPVSATRRPITVPPTVRTTFRTSTPRPTTHKLTTTPKPEPASECSTSTAYYVVIGNEIILPISGAENDVKVIQGIEQSECAKHCSSNKGPRGDHIKCSSINYFPVTQKCEMYSILAEPHGPGNLVENDDVIYSEKFCLPPNTADCHDDEIFLLQVQKKVVGRQISVTSATSITNCLKACLNARGCLIASYDSNRNRCSLHSVDIGENPTVVQDAEPGWVLIENGCSGKRRKPSSALQGVAQVPVEDVPADTKWSSWSDCQFRVHGDLVRVRTRQCEVDCPDGGMQLEKC